MTILGKLIDGNLRTELSFDIDWFRDSIFANLGDKLLSLVPPFYELLSLLLSVVSLSLSDTNDYFLPIVLWWKLLLKWLPFLSSER